jgi:phosphoglycolate phosphatase-like HAD superfamily hydrolase
VAGCAAGAGAEAEDGDYKGSSNMKIKFLITSASLFIGTQVFAAGLLGSWNDGPAKRTIVDFVNQVTAEGTPTYVPPDRRIATFANDGTLWAEQPYYIQFQFAIDRIKALAPKHPEWKTQEPFSQVLAGNTQAFIAGGYQSMITALAIAHAGLTSDEYSAIIKDWIHTARDPKTGLPYTHRVYYPMLELLAYLRSNGFKTYIVSGGGTEFIRTFAEEAYGIPPDQVIGSSGKVKYEVRNGEPVLVKLPDALFVNNGEAKVVKTQMQIGRRPIAAIGSGDGDLPMMQWTSRTTSATRASGDSTPRLIMVIHHDDAVREWAYDRNAPVGKLDKALDEAQAKGWTVVSMRNDWYRIFP